MQVRRGPAAVTGDEIPHKPLGNWEGWESRMIREPEDLPLVAPHTPGEGTGVSMFVVFDLVPSERSIC